MANPSLPLSAAERNPSNVQKNGNARCFPRLIRRKAEERSNEAPGSKRSRAHLTFLQTATSLRGLAERGHDGSRGLEPTVGGRPELVRRVSGACTVRRRRFQASLTRRGPRARGGSIPWTEVHGYRRVVAPRRQESEMRKATYFAPSTIWQTIGSSLRLVRCS
jgi:hypothetical protein